MRLGGALLLGIGVTAASLAFGSRPLGVVGVGLLLAATAARSWAGLVRGSVSVSHGAIPSPAVEGERVRMRIGVRRSSRIPIGSAVGHGVLGRLGPFSCRLHGHGRELRGELDLGRLPRGRFSLSEARLVLGDHLGLESVTREVDAGGLAVVVHPRLVEVETLFSDAGRYGADGRRLLLRRSTGFDLHSVREYAQGESLRRVHWPSTARTGQLMVKELEDSPRETVSVLLDCDPGFAAGEPPSWSFDAAVRAAGSILRHYAVGGRKASLLTTAREGVAQPVTTVDGDLPTALGVLAAVEPDAHFGIGPWLRQEQTRATSAGELVVVTSNLEPAALDAILATATRRLVAVVWVDAASYVGRPTRAAPGPLRLSASGIPVAVVRHGEDLGAALDFTVREEQAHG